MCFYAFSMYFFRVINEQKEFENKLQLKLNILQKKENQILLLNNKILNYKNIEKSINFNNNYYNFNNKILLKYKFK